MEKINLICFYFKSKNHFKETIAKNNFYVKDIGFSKFKVFDQFEYETIITAIKK